PAPPRTLLTLLRSTYTATTPTYTLSLHDALPIWAEHVQRQPGPGEPLSRGQSEHRDTGPDGQTPHLVPGPLGTTQRPGGDGPDLDRKSTRLNSSHVKSSYAVFGLKKKNREEQERW